MHSVAQKSAWPAQMECNIHSSLAFTIGVTELLAQGKLLATATLQFFEAYLAVGIIYWGMTILYSWLQKWYETRINKPYEV